MVVIPALTSNGISLQHSLRAVIQELLVDEGEKRSGGNAGFSAPAGVCHVRPQIKKKTNR